MDYSDRALVFASIITQVGGFAAVWLKTRTTARQTKGTGNGFASDVRNALSRIEKKVDTHINDHARQEIELEREKRKKWPWASF